MSHRYGGSVGSGPPSGVGTGAGGNGSGSGRTPLSMRWAQMSQQEKIIERKRLEVLERLEAKKAEAKPSNTQVKSPATVNKFSNDGSFMDQFRKLAQAKTATNSPEIKLPPNDNKEKTSEQDKDENTGRKYSQDSSESIKDKDHKERSRERDTGRERSRDWSRERDQSRGKDREDDRGREDRRDRRRSPSGSGRGRSRSPKRRDDKYDNNRDNRSKRWDSDNDRRPRRRTPSPPPEEHRRRKSRFSSPDHSVPPMSNMPPFMPGNDPPFKPPLMGQQPFNNSPFGNQQFNNPPMNNHNFSGPPPNALNQIGPPPFFNNFNNSPNNNFMPPNLMNPHRGPFDPPILMNFPNSSVPPLCNTMPPPPFNPKTFPNMPPGNQPPEMNHSNMPPFLPNNMSLPNFPPPNNLASIRPPMGLPGPVPNMQFPLGINIPLHNIPEPKPLDTMSIPPPKPLDAMSIPPPKPLDAMSIPPPKPLDTVKIPPPAPLDAVRIPPPGPMNLQKIPPPMPLCLNQIPKPKELDLCTIPPPLVGNVLSTDDCRSGSLMEEIALQVARSGQELEMMLIAQSDQDPSLWFLQDSTSPEFTAFRALVTLFQERSNIKDSGVNNRGQSIPVPDDEKYEPEYSLQDNSEDESNNKQNNDTKISDRKNYDSSDSDDMDKYKRESREKRRKKRKSRWGDSADPAIVGAPGIVNIGAPGIANITSLGGAALPIPSNVVSPAAPVLPITGEKTKFTRVSRQDPGLLQYATKNFGGANLTEEEWTKCEEHYKISLIYQDMLIKRLELDRLTAKGHHKYEYDSDEDVDGGTWEHKLRQKEMESTSRWSTELNKAGHGKHHIGDFLPPDELKKFMEKYSAFKTGVEPDHSDYREHKITEENIGFKMLQKLGWMEGKGLGADGSGIVNPVNKGSSREMNQGLGTENNHIIDEGDDEFDAYRKRMMLAYRFRPNPMNNPRRPYY